MLGERLLSVAKFVRQGAVFADVGTDHAYLPVFLLKEKKISAAICSDINEGPLANARATAKEEGITENIDFVLTDGAAALAGRGITDMAICGMGGELIAEIIGAAPYLKGEGVRLILQPMTRQEHLRRYLYAEGFLTVGEAYATEAGKSYLVIAAEYTGNRANLTEREIAYGRANPDCREAQAAYISAKLASLKKRRCGLAIANDQADQDAQDALAVCDKDIEYLEGILKSLGENENDR